ncbi:MAG: ribosome biogenesis GTP-binding protein YihA/YsxC [Acholeplasmataceae bacterium]
MFHQSEYVISKPGYEKTLDDKPSMFMLGRSNVGKSSFINALLNRKNLARTSSTPGKTIALNYYIVDQEFYIIDAPGYGYAKRSKSHQDEFYFMLNDILLNQQSLKTICLLIDFKVGPTKDDLDVWEQLKQYKLPVVVIATKVDKISKTKRYKQQKTIETTLNHSIYPVSNTTKLGFTKIKEYIDGIL